MEGLIMGTVFLFWGGVKNVLELVIVAQLREYTKKHSLVCFESVNYRLRGLHLNKAGILQKTQYQVGKLEIKIIIQITCVSNVENSLIQQYIIQTEKCWRPTVVPDIAPGAGNMATSIAKPLPSVRGHSNNPALRILAGVCDLRIGGTPKEKVLGVGRKAAEPPCSLKKQCSWLFSVLHPIQLFLILTTNSPASRKTAPTDSGSKLL